MRSPRRTGYKQKSRLTNRKAVKKARRSRGNSGYMPKGKRGRY